MSHNMQTKMTSVVVKDLIAKATAKDLTAKAKATAELEAKDLSSRTHMYVCMYVRKFIHSAPLS